jgi:putative Ca2+/H+ antiporter (TMEM165/GDT1 family)
LAGEGIAQLFPPKTLKALAAVGFALMAVRLLWFSKSEDSQEELD